MALFPIGFESEAMRDTALRLANGYHFLIDNKTLPRLCVTADKLVLYSDTFSPLYADFNSVHLKRRLNAGKQQGLVRACKPTKGLRILDVTAGWGRDALLLASFGADVLMIERQSVMAALLEDALSRYNPIPSAGSLSLLHHDAKHYLQMLSPLEYPDVIYIDPMHPQRQKSALVKKDMQALQGLFGSDEDASDLLQMALVRATKKVVVKWPERLHPLLPPTHSLHGKTVRFDIYIPHMF